MDKSGVVGMRRFLSHGSEILVAGPSEATWAKARGTRAKLSTSGTTHHAPVGQKFSTYVENHEGRMCPKHRPAGDGDLPGLPSLSSAELLQAAQDLAGVERAELTASSSPQTGNNT